MKNIKFAVLILGLFSVIHKVIGDDYLKLGGYLRAGTGINGWGEDHVCPKISGVPGNFMRLGNECGTYGEMNFSYSPQKAWEKAEKPYQVMNVNFAVSEPGHTNSEGSSTSDGNGDLSISMVESYLTLGNLFKMENSKIWVGKRWYRETDIHILDWFHWADMSGIGAGISGIKLGEGLVKVAFLNAPTDPDTSEGKSTKGSGGTVSKKVVDMRYMDLDLGIGTLDTWLAVGFNKGGKTVDTTTGNDVIYSSNTGYILGFKFKFSDNEFGLAYATGNMESMSMKFDLTYALKDIGNTKKNKYEEAKRFRIFNQGKIVFGNLEILHAITWDMSELGPAKITSGSKTVVDKESFFGAAIRPVYFFSDHFSLASEVGWVSLDREEAPISNLTRFTLSPQIHLNKGIWGRPVIRFYISQTFVNSAIAETVASNAGIIGAPENYSNYGIQFESWF
ncbi:MAG: carbohydrate porin [Halobacteriovoraceae bacterium]|nr:carbohydrate porin [Halobacteriovoraceae bacterium]